MNLVPAVCFNDYQLIFKPNFLAEVAELHRSMVTLDVIRGQKIYSAQATDYLFNQAKGNHSAWNAWVSIYNMSWHGLIDIG
jgi:hypothetical protein